MRTSRVESVRFSRFFYYVLLVKVLFMERFIVLFLLISICCFFGVLFFFVTKNCKMFFKPIGKLHALNGFIALVLLVYGFADVFINKQTHMAYHVLLGVVLTFLPITALEFGHEKVDNVASGSLDPHATISRSEMLEHVFYQMLNLVNILYYHSIPHVEYSSIYMLCFLSSGIWVFRDFFPVNRFSDNYTKIDPKSTDWIRLLYRMKKWQYVFLKHFLQFGLNLSIAIMATNYRPHMIYSLEFRWFWMFLNTSFVMEFFLQTMVKKGYLQQKMMLELNFLLMICSSITAVFLMHKFVFWQAGLASLVLNFVNRKHDTLNMGIMICGIYIVYAMVAFKVA